jgi:hypothetical protein
VLTCCVRYLGLRGGKADFKMGFKKGFRKERSNLRKTAATPPYIPFITPRILRAVLVAQISVTFQLSGNTALLGPPPRCEPSQTVVLALLKGLDCGCCLGSAGSVTNAVILFRVFDIDIMQGFRLVACFPHSFTVRIAPPWKVRWLGPPRLQSQPGERGDWHRT